MYNNVLCVCVCALSEESKPCRMYKYSAYCTIVIYAAAFFFKFHFVAFSVYFLYFNFFIILFNNNNNERKKDCRCGYGCVFRSFFSVHSSVFSVSFLLMAYEISLHCCCRSTREQQQQQRRRKKQGIFHIL